MLMPATFLASALVQFGLGLATAWILGPAEFGRYALALAGAVFAQTLIFEWLRLAAIRYHQAGAPARRFLRLFAGAAALALVLAGLALAVPGTPRGLLLLGAAIALAAGYAELRAALLRAAFDETGYVRIVAVRNGAAVLTMPAAALATGSAEGGLAGFLGSVLAALAADALRTRRAAAPPPDPVAGARADDLPRLHALIGYSGPIIATNIGYLAIFLALRGASATLGGLAAAGQFSLAFDLIAKLVTTIGTAADLALFQLAVRAERENGVESGFAAARRNLAALLAILAPVALGLMLVLPDLEILLVAPGFRGPFRAFAEALIPGLTLYALIQYALHPFFQLRHRTLPLAGAALAATAIIAASLPFLRLAGAGLPLATGLSLAAGMTGAGALLASRLGRTMLPERGDGLRLGVALAALLLGALPGRMLDPGLAALMATAAGGAAAYGLAALLLDLAGVRTLLRDRRRNGLS
jgi:O-antigen/teichoic acid export membrane protein